MRNYLGARGLGIKYMMDEIDPKIDPFEPQNRFIIATGPLTCMPPAGNRTYFVTKSPLTRGIANAGVGGYFGSELKFAGFDFIVIQGKGEGPEYESVASLGAVTGVDNLPAVIKASRMCNDMGMDTISAGVTVGCAMELFERGVLPEKDVGYPLNFGDAEGLLDLVQKMASREGFGWIMGEGSYRLADRYGHPELSMTVKKQELPNYDPRGVKGRGLPSSPTIGGQIIAGRRSIVRKFMRPPCWDTGLLEKIGSSRHQGQGQDDQTLPGLLRLGL
ncbi:MAG: aldehyde ferredoxin oxidoreductase C-terminal domain-containing protein [Desulfobacterales bacterium]